MRDYLWTHVGHVTSHTGQLSLAIPPRTRTVTAGHSWGINKHTSPVSVAWQCKLVSGGELMKRRSAPLYGPCGLGRTLRLLDLHAPKGWKAELSVCMTCFVLISLASSVHPSQWTPSLSWVNFGHEFRRLI